MAALRELLNVSQLEVMVSTSETVQIGVSKAAGEKCERCWHWETEVGSHQAHPTLCHRCVEAVQAAASALSLTERLKPLIRLHFAMASAVWG